MDVFDFQIFVKKAADVDAPAALAAVERAAEEYPGSNGTDQTEYKEDQTQFVDQILGLVYALLAGDPHRFVGNRARWRSRSSNEHANSV